MNRAKIKQCLKLRTWTRGYVIDEATQAGALVSLWDSADGGGRGQAFVYAERGATAVDASITSVYTLTLVPHKRVPILLMHSTVSAHPTKRVAQHFRQVFQPVFSASS